MSADNFRGFVLCACATAAAAWLVYRAARRLLDRPPPGVFHEVVFFPESSAPPPAGASACERDQPPVDGRRLECVLRRLAAARRTLDVCVFVLSCPELCGALVAAGRRGVRVRVVLDEEMSTCTGSQLPQLRRAGLQVFVKPKPFLMHHKFAVVDNEVLVCGSFNWTRQAALGNNEDVIITNDVRLVKPFVGEFNKLWAMKR